MAGNQDTDATALHRFRERYAAVVAYSNVAKKRIEAFDPHFRLIPRLCMTSVRVNQSE